MLGAQHPGLDGGPTSGSVPELAARYAEQLERVAPAGGVVLAGWSMGGVVALEMACLLGRRGTVAVDRVVVLDGWAGADPSAPPADTATVVRDFRQDSAGAADPNTDPTADPTADPAADERLFAVYRADYDALRGHPPTAPAVPVDLLVAGRASPSRAGLVPLHEVLDRSAAPVTTVEVDADHFSIVTGPAVLRIAAHLGRVAGAGGA